MYVDIHTHIKSEITYPSIRNLTFPEAETFFSSDSKETVSLGIHPWHADDFSEKTMSDLEKYATNERLVAIGECGLDKNSKATIGRQLLVLAKQIELSEQTKKPVIIHCVGCFNELFELKKTIKPQQIWLIHGFRGKPQLAEQLLKNGCAISFGAHFNPDSVRITPLDKLFVETDESQLQIEEIYRKIAVAKNCNPNDITAGRLFFQQIQHQK